MFLNKEGLPTYESKEIALALKKYEDFKFDKSIIITANEQTPYFNVVLDALSQLEPLIANSTVHFGHGMVKLPELRKCQVERVRSLKVNGLNEAKER